VKYSIYQAKARLSEVIRMVKARRRVIITERGVPVAEVVPYSQDLPESLTERITRLSTNGSIIRCKGPFSTKPLTIHPGAVERFLRLDRES
jgi:prevent-host-death family protein